MSTPPKLTDRCALCRQRKRARQLAKPAIFMQQDAADEVKERLTLVNRNFTNAVIVTGWPEVWAPNFPDAKIIADTETLDLKQSTHDLVIHALSLHWANDPVGQLIQAKRALKPDGLFLAALFGGQTLYELRATLAEAEIEASGGISPRIAPMAEIRELGALLQRAGFALPVADSLITNVTYENAFKLMRDVRSMGEGNAMVGRQKSFCRRNLMQGAADRYAVAFPAPENRITATFEVIYLSGWAPDDSQQKPLRPGSATARLADVLEVTETRITEVD